jgi:hypothetical protein
LLKKLDALNKKLQSEEASFQVAVDVINTTKEIIQDMNTEEQFDLFWNEANSIAVDYNHQPQIKRARTFNTLLADYDISGPGSVRHVAQTPVTGDEVPHNERSTALKTYQHLLTTIATELERRFGTLQCDIAAAVEATYPSSKNFMDKAILQPLADLTGVVLDSNELQLAKRFYSLETGRATDPATIQRSSASEAMPSVRHIISISRTIGVSTARCESSFSTLKRILTPQRCSMLHKRKADLVLISFEKDLATKIQCSESLLRRFWESGPKEKRRLQLF